MEIKSWSAIEGWAVKLGCAPSWRLLLNARIWPVRMSVGRKRFDY